MDNCALPFVWNRSLESREDVNGTDGLSCLTDTTLRLSSHGASDVAPKPKGAAGARKVESDVDFLDLENGVSVALELGCSSKLTYIEPDIVPCSEKDAEGFTHGSMTTGTHNGLPKVDLELSLSTVAAESDITSTSRIPSPSQFGKGTLALSNIEQLVDDGSTTSKWKSGSLVAYNGSMVANASAPLEGSHSFLSQVAASPYVPLVYVPSAADVAGDSRPKQQRKTTVKPCQFPDCQKGARGASGYCISHGGGRRCQKPGCQKGAEGKTTFCKAHGGGRRCEHPGCTKSAEGRTNRCISHGGGRRCMFPEGCSHAARGKSELCIRHGGGKRCKMENCSKSAEGVAGLCIAHGGGRRCQHPQCTKGAQGSTRYCKAHGGGKRCTFLGCTKGAEGSTLFCKGHGGGKRCSFEGGGICSKSVHGGTLYCVLHGGGKRCGISGCTKSARGRTEFCVRHGGGKRCKFDGCGKSAQGSTNFCKAHGGGNRCLWGQPGSAFGGDSPCDKIARGKFGLCTAHVAQVQDKRVHGNGTVGLKMKGTETDGGVANIVPAEGCSSFRNEFTFGAHGHGYLPGGEHLVGTSNNSDSSYPASFLEGRVHGGGLWLC